MKLIGFLRGFYVKWLSSGCWCVDKHSCWAEVLVETRVGWMAVRMAAQRAGSRAVNSADLMVGWMA